MAQPLHDELLRLAEPRRQFDEANEESYRQFMKDQDYIEPALPDGTPPRPSGYVLCATLITKGRGESYGWRRDILMLGQIQWQNLQENLQQARDSHRAPTAHLGRHVREQF